MASCGQPVETKSRSHRLSTGLEKPFLCRVFHSSTATTAAIRREENEDQDFTETGRKVLLVKAVYLSRKTRVPLSASIF